MRILFLHEVNYLNKPIFEMHEFPEHLATLGHTVGFVQFPEGESRASLAMTPFKQQIQGRVLTSQSITLYTPETLSGSFLGRLLAVLTFKASFRRIVQDFAPDVVVSFSVPTSGWQAVQVCKKLGVPLVFRALDVSHKIRKSAFSNLIRWAERFIYKNADWVSANNPEMANYVMSKGTRSDGVSINFPPLDLKHFQAEGASRKNMRRVLLIPESANVIVYMGSFFYFSGLNEVLRSFARGAQTNDRLMLIGSGDLDRELKKLSRDLGVQKQVLFTGMVEYINLPRYLNAADVAINPLSPSLVTHTALPNKVLQYMAAGLPVVSTRLKGLELTFPNRPPGLIFVERPADLMGVAFDAVRGNSAGLGEMNLSLVNKIFGVESSIKSFENQLLSVARRNS